jgi:hypothetical protein
MSAGAYDPAGASASDGRRNVNRMKSNLLGPLRDAQVGTLALAIALGWSLYQTALGIATLIEGALTRTGGLGGFTGYVQSGLGLTWVWHHRVFTFGQLVLGLIELGTVLLVAVFVRRRTRDG